MTVRFLRAKGLILWIILLGLPAVASAQYQIEKAVVSSGGGEAAGGAYSVTFTIGQPAAGGPLVSSSNRAYTGFWVPPQMPITAAGVTVSGRVLDPFGRGISRAFISLTDMRGTKRILTTNTFGYFKFANVPAGETYVLSVSARRYRFESPQAISVMDDVTGLNFHGVVSSP
jgi:hypothetical protein